MQVLEKILCQSCGKILSQNDFYTGKNGSLFKDCKDCHKEKCWNREKANQNKPHANIIDIADEFLSLHGIDFLKIVRERRKR